MAVLALATHHHLQPGAQRRAPGWYVVRLDRAVLALDKPTDEVVIGRHTVLEGPYRRRPYAFGRMLKLGGVPGGGNA